MSSNLNLKGVLGLGSASTHYYLHSIHEKFRENNDEFSTCPLLLYQIDFQEIDPYLPNQFSILIPKLDYYFCKILEAGISNLLIPNITLHETLDQMKLPFQIYHPVDLTLNYLKENNITEVFLFGTLYTMNSAYLKNKFQAEGIALLRPVQNDQIWIEDFRRKVYDKKETPIEIGDFQNLAKKYADENPVVIACTELSLYASKTNSSCIDMANLQIEEFLK